ncbi:MAG: hypothetical protein ACREJ6_11775 [Candidatus Methylomirabilis sp.]
MTRSRTDGLRAIEAEIAREKAKSLGRAGERLEEALNELESVRGVDVERCYRVSERLR